jgi:hypothetical protein
MNQSEIIKKPMLIVNSKKHSFFLEKRSYGSLILALPFVLLFIVLWWQGPWLQPDTQSYLTKSPVRSALYPLFLQLNTWLSSNQWGGLLFAQLALGFYSAFFTASKLKKLFALNPWLILLLFVLFLIPYYGPLKFGNSILTEAVCYPIFLFASTFLLEGLFQRKTKPLLYFLAFTSLLILTRRQFLFLYPAFTCVLIYLTVVHRKHFNLGLLTVTFVLSIVGTHLLERTYQYLNDNHFATLPFTGMQLVVAPLYLSTPNDVELFETTLEKTIFLKVQEKMQAKQLSYQAINTRPHFNLAIYPQFLNLVVYPHYFESYGPICWEILFPILSEQGFKDLYEIDSFTTHMALTLIQAHFKEYLALYASNIIFNLGGLFPTLFLGLIALLAFIYHCLKKDNLSLGILVTLLLTSGNYLLVAIVEPILIRYSIYTTVLSLAMLTITLSFAFQHWKDISYPENN